MGKFGWSYPPGVSSLPWDEDDHPCEVCGQPLEKCICPECPECGSFGDPHCYINHGLRRTEKQKFFLECNEREWQEENDYWAQMDRDYPDSILEDDIDF